MTPSPLLRVVIIAVVVSICAAAPPPPPAAQETVATAVNAYIISPQDALSDSSLLGMALAASGTVALVGVPKYLRDNKPIGAVLAYSCGTTDLGTTACTPLTQAALVAVDATSNSYFGASVSIDPTTALVAVGAPRHTHSSIGKVYIYDCAALPASPCTYRNAIVAPTSTSGVYFGQAVAVQPGGTGRVAIVNAKVDSNKSIGYVYNCTGVSAHSPCTNIIGLAYTASDLSRISITTNAAPVFTDTNLVAFGLGGIGTFAVWDLTASGGCPVKDGFPMCTPVHTVTAAAGSTCFGSAWAYVNNILILGDCLAGDAVGVVYFLACPDLRSCKFSTGSLVQTIANPVDTVAPLLALSSHFGGTLDAAATSPDSFMLAVGASNLDFVLSDGAMFVYECTSPNATSVTCTGQTGKGIYYPNSKSNFGNSIALARSGGTSMGYAGYGLVAGSKGAADVVVFASPKTVPIAVNTTLDIQMRITPLPVDVAHPGDGLYDSYLGFAAAIYDDLALVSAPFYIQNGLASGAVFVYTCTSPADSADGTTCTQIPTATIFPPVNNFFSNTNHAFGYSLATDGKLLAISAPNGYQNGEGSDNNSNNHNHRRSNSNGNGGHNHYHGGDSNSNSNSGSNSGHNHYHSGDSNSNSNSDGNGGHNHYHGGNSNSNGGHNHYHGGDSNSNSDSNSGHNHYHGGNSNSNSDSNGGHNHYHGGDSNSNSNSGSNSGHNHYHGGNSNSNSGSNSGHNHYHGGDSNSGSNSGHGNSNDNSGTVFLYDCSLLPGTPCTYLRSLSAPGGNQFGASVAVSNGMVVIANGYVDASKHVAYIYDCRAVSSTVPCQTKYALVYDVPQINPHDEIVFGPSPAVISGTLVALPILTTLTFVVWDTTKCGGLSNGFAQCNPVNVIGAPSSQSNDNFPIGYAYLPPGLLVLGFSDTIDASGHASAGEINFYDCVDLAACTTSPTLTVTCPDTSNDVIDAYFGSALDIAIYNESTTEIFVAAGAQGLDANRGALFLFMCTGSSLSHMTICHLLSKTNAPYYGFFGFPIALSKTALGTFGGFGIVAATSAPFTQAASHTSSGQVFLIDSIKPSGSNSSQPASNVQLPAVEATNVFRDLLIPPHDDVFSVAESVTDHLSCYIITAGGFYATGYQANVEFGGTTGTAPICCLYWGVVNQNTCQRNMCNGLPLMDATFSPVDPNIVPVDGQSCLPLSNTCYTTTISNSVVVFRGEVYVTAKGGENLQSVSRRRSPTQIATKDAFAVIQGSLQAVYTVQSTTGAYYGCQLKGVKSDNTCIIENCQLTVPQSSFFSDPTSLDQSVCYTLCITP